MTEKIPETYPWIRFYHALLNRVEFMTLSNDLKGLYLLFYLLAARAGAEGMIGDGDRIFTDKDMAWHLRMDVSDLTEGVEALAKAGFVRREDGGVVISDFIETQGPGPGGRLEEQRSRWRKWQRDRRERLKNDSNAQNKELRTENKELRTKNKELRTKNLEGHADVRLTHDITHDPTTPEIEPAKKSKSNQEIYAIAEVLAEVTGISMAISKKQLVREARELVQDDRVTPELIRIKYSPGGPWYLQDWRGMKGQKPTLYEIRATLFSFAAKDPNVIRGGLKDRPVKERGGLKEYT